MREGVTAGEEPPGGPLDLIVCVSLPSRAQFAGLVARGPVLLLVTPSQLAYARSIASPLTAVRLPGAADRAADAAETLRRQVAARIEAGNVEAEMLLLEPLFEAYDPAEVAAALYALGRGTGDGGRVPSPHAPSTTQWVKLFVNVGKKDRVGAKDLVGALIHEVGLQKADIGRIELRDAFSTVEVAPGVAAAAAQKLSGVSIRGRRAQAKVDRNG
jgi:ATP-dependent RNA helicase DeaD